MNILIQKICDIGLFTLHKSPKTNNFPCKIIGYMAQGMPILGCLSAGIDLENLLNENQAGFVCQNGNDDALYENCKILVAILS